MEQESYFRHHAIYYRYIVGGNVITTINRLAVLIDDTHLLCRKYCFEQTFTSNTGLYILDNAIFDAQYAFLTIKVWIFGNICLPL